MLNPNMRKTCVAGLPVPFNRMDLLLPRNPPSNGYQVRPPKYPRPLHRPDTAMTMILNIDAGGYRGDDLEDDYDQRYLTPPSVNRGMLSTGLTQPDTGRGVEVMPISSRGDIVSAQAVAYMEATRTLNLLGQPSIKEQIAGSISNYSQIRSKYQAMMAPTSAGAGGSNDPQYDEEIEKMAGDTAAMETEIAAEKERQRIKDAPMTPATPKGKGRMSADKKMSTPSLSGESSPGHYSRMMGEGIKTREGYYPRSAAPRREMPATYEY